MDKDQRTVQIGTFIFSECFWVIAPAINRLSSRPLNGYERKSFLGYEYLGWRGMENFVNTSLLMELGNENSLNIN